MNIDLRKIKSSIQSRPDLMNTLQQVSREISDNNKLQLYHNFLERLRAVVKFKSTITHNKVKYRQSCINSNHYIAS